MGAIRRETVWRVLGGVAVAVVAYSALAYASANWEALNDAWRPYGSQPWVSATIVTIAYMVGYSIAFRITEKNARRRGQVRTLPPGRRLP